MLTSTNKAEFLYLMVSRFLLLLWFPLFCFGCLPACFFSLSRSVSLCLALSRSVSLCSALFCSPRFRGLLLCSASVDDVVLCGSAVVSPVLWCCSILLAWLLAYFVLLGFSIPLPLPCPH